MSTKNIYRYLQESVEVDANETQATFPISVALNIKLRKASTVLQGIKPNSEFGFFLLVK